MSNDMSKFSYILNNIFTNSVNQNNLGSKMNDAISQYAREYWIKQLRKTNLVEEFDNWKYRRQVLFLETIACVGKEGVELYEELKNRTSYAEKEDFFNYWLDNIGNGNLGYISGFEELPEEVFDFCIEEGICMGELESIILKGNLEEVENIKRKLLISPYSDLTKYELSVLNLAERDGLIGFQEGISLGETRESRVSYERIRLLGLFRKKIEKDERRVEEIIISSPKHSAYYNN